MQWAFLVLALFAALVELHTGTFYLAGVAAAALVTTLAGFWLRDELLIFIFVLLCVILTGAVTLVRLRHKRAKDRVDFDVGQMVTVQGVSQGDHLTVNYRGATWEAVMDDGSLPAPGSTAVIQRRTDKLLHLTVPPERRRT